MKSPSTPGEQLSLVDPNERPKCPKHPGQLIAIGCDSCRAAAYAWQCKACKAWNQYLKSFCQFCFVRRWSRERIGERGPRSPRRG